jgi:hypothetical protein
MLRTTIAIACAVALAACSRGPKAPPREAVQTQLQQEAQAVKAEMEKIDPSLGVAATWTVDAIEIKERPDDTARPWAGKVKFKIESATREPDGSAAVQRREKSFDYLYDVEAKKWQMQYSAR